MSNDEDDGDGFRRCPSPADDSAWFPIGGYETDRHNGGAPGKRSLIQGIRAADPRSILIAKLRTVRGQISGVRGRHLPGMTAAIESRDINAARSAAPVLGIALGTIDRELGEARELAMVITSEAARTMVTEVAAEATNLHADADPVLALAPPAALKIPVLAAFAVHLFLDDLVANDTTEADQRRQWLARLDARTGRDALDGKLIDASRRFGEGKPGRAAATIDRPAAHDDARATIDDSPARRASGVAPTRSRADRAAATIDMPAEYDDTRATIDDSPTHRAPTHGAADRGAATIDKPAEYDDTRATIDDSPDDHAPVVARTRSRPDREAATIDKPADYEDTRATISDSPRIADRLAAEPEIARPDRARPDRAATTIDKPAEYEDTRATIDDSPERSTAVRPAASARPDLRGGDRAAATIDKAAEYEDTRATIDDLPGAAPAIAEASPRDLGPADRAAATIDMPAEYEDTRATIDDSPDDDDDTPDPDRSGGKRKRRRRRRPAMLARSGKAGASAGVPLPTAVRRQLEATLGTDLGTVRVHNGTAAARLADVHGAQAFAYGDDIVLGAGHDPDAPGSFELLAHEVAHTVQQRSGGKRIQRRAKDGSPESAEEREADHVAMQAHSGKTSDEVTAAEYAARHLADIEQAVREFIGGKTFEASHPDVRFLGTSFVGHVVGELTRASSLETWRGVMAPASIIEIIDANRPLTKADEQASTAGVQSGRLSPSVGFAFRTAADIGPRGPSRWSPSVGIAVAAIIDERLRASLARMVPRFATVSNDRAALVNLAPVTADELVPSHPIDRVVARALCTDGVVERIPASREQNDGVEPAAATTPAAKKAAADQAAADKAAAGRTDADARHHNQQRRVYGRFQAGPLWNWMRVESPDDATAEEVAATVLGDAAQAYQVVASPPLFGFPESVALRIPDAAAHHPSVRAGTRPTMVVAGEAPTALTLADQGGITDELALAEAGRTVAPPQADAPILASTVLTDMDVSQLRLEALIDRLAPFGVAPLLMSGVSWLATKRAQLSSGTGDPLVWDDQARQQRRILGDIVGDVEVMVVALEDSAGAGAAPASGSDAGARAAAAAAAIPRAQRQVLRAYAQAAAVSHLPETAGAMVVEARKLRTLSIVAALEDILGAAVGLVETVHVSSDEFVGSSAHHVAYTSRGLRERQAALRMRVAQLRVNLLAGLVDPVEIDDLFKQCESLHVEALLVAQIQPIEATLSPLRVARDSTWTAMFDAVIAPVVDNPLPDATSGPIGMWARHEVRDLQDSNPAALVSAGEWLQTQLNRLMDDWNKAQAWLSAPKSEFEVADAQARLALVRARLQEIGQRGDVQEFLRKASDALQDAQAKAFVSQLAVLIAVTLVSSGVGSLARGFVLGRSGATAVAGLADITVSGFTQAAIESGLLGTSFVDNFANEMTFGAASNAAASVASDLVRGNAKAARALEKGLAGGGAFLVAKGAELSLRAVLIGGVQYAQIQFDAARTLGRTLSWDEVLGEGAKGMAMMIGVGVVEGATKINQRLTALGAKSAQASKLAAKARRVGDLARDVEIGGDPALALEAIREHRAVLDAESAMYRGMAGEVDPAVLDTLQAGVDKQLAGLDDIEATGLAARASLDEVVPGRVFTGDTGRIDEVLAHYRRAGYEVSAQPDERGGVRFAVRKGDHEIEIIDRTRRDEARSTAPAAAGLAAPAGSQAQGEANDAARPPLQDHVDPKWLTPDQGDAARWQSHGIENDPRGRALADSDAFREAYGQWMSQPVRFTEDGKVNFPADITGDVRTQLEAVAKQGNITLTTQALQLAERIRADFRGMSFDPSSPEWKARRPELAKQFGEPQIARYEQAVGQSTGDPARADADQRIEQLVHPDDLASFIARFPNAQVYVTGSATQASKPLAQVTDLDVLIVVPDDMPQPVRVELEQRAMRQRLRRGDGSSEERLEVDAKVMTTSQFAGWSLVPTPDGRTPLRDVRVDQPGQDAVPGTADSGVDLHNHVMGVPGTDYFVDRVGGGSAVALLETTWSTLNDPRHWPTSKRPISAEVHQELTDAVADVRNHRDDMPAAALEARARRALDKVLAASEQVPFDHTYDVRDLLVKEHIDPGDGAYKNFATDTIRGLHDQGVTYSEQSVSLKKLATKFDEATMREVHAQLAAEGQDSDLRFLGMLSTSRVLSGPGAHADPDHPDVLAFKQDLATVAGLLQRPDVMGIDIAGPEAQAFTAGGMENFGALLALMKQAGQARGRPLVLRPHVGEGYDPGRGGQHAKIARDNLQQLLDTLVAAAYAGPSDGVVIRFGHAAHATPAQLAVMAQLGIVVEANIGSNLATASVATPDQHPLLYNLYFGARTILSTDAQGVMGTTLPIEYQRAAALIEEFRAGETRLVIDGKPVGFTELAPDVQQRFSIATLVGWASAYATDVRAGDAHDTARPDVATAPAGASEETTAQ